MIKNIFCIWSGNNEMSNNRKNNLQSIINNSGCEVNLITPKNLHIFENSAHPIHPSYEYLSLTHKADYLRCYLMHHYGGGYTDIKYLNFNWTTYFNVLDNSEYMFIGYKEATSEHIASDSIEIRQKFASLCGCGHFIMKPYSEFTTKWINTLHQILDSKLWLLRQYPGHYHPRAIFGGVHQEENSKYNGSQYPLGWNEILGRIIHPLMYEYIGKFLHSMPPPQLHSYR